MMNVTVKLLTSSTIEELPLGIPKPMLAIGFVPSNIRAEKGSISTIGAINAPVKNIEGKYSSRWKWNFKKLLYKRRYLRHCCGSL